MVGSTYLQSVSIVRYLVWQTQHQCVRVALEVDVVSNIFNGVGRPFPLFPYGPVVIICTILQNIILLSVGQRQAVIVDKLLSFIMFCSSWKFALRDYSYRTNMFDGFTQSSPWFIQNSVFKGTINNCLPQYRMTTTHAMLPQGLWNLVIARVNSFRSAECLYVVLFNTSCSVSVSPSPNSPWVAVGLQPGKIFTPKDNKLVYCLNSDTKKVNHIFDAGVYVYMYMGQTHALFVLHIIHVYVPPSILMP